MKPERTVLLVMGIEVLRLGCWRIFDRSCVNWCRKFLTTGGASRPSNRTFCDACRRFLDTCRAFGRSPRTSYLSDGSSVERVAPRTPHFGSHHPEPVSFLRAPP